jgi:hypothetical protein
VKRRAQVFSRTVCLLTGAYYSAFGALLFVRPYTFWRRFAPIGAFNEHYTRDVDSFLLPLGVFLVVAVLDPRRFRAVVRIAAGGSGLHAVSHFLDGIGSTRDLISDLALSTVAVPLLLATFGREESET